MKPFSTVSATAMLVAMMCVGHLYLVSEARAATDTIRCTSQDNGYTECPATMRGNVRLARRLSDAACTEGRSWGYDEARAIIWVDGGCRGDFTVESRFDGRFGRNGAAALGPDNIRTLRNGETEVTMSRNCVIIYDVRGYRIRSSRACSGDDITRSDQQYASYRNQGGNNRRFGQAPDNIPDNILPLRNGETEVTMSRNCVIAYDATGYRIRSDSGCSGDDITRSDQQYASYRNQTGGGGRFGRLPDNMQTFRNGETEITMSRNCVIIYDATGYRIRSDRGCSGDDITRSDQEYASYRR